MVSLASHPKGQSLRTEALRKVPRWHSVCAVEWGWWFQPVHATVCMHACVFSSDQALGFVCVRMCFLAINSWGYTLSSITVGEVWPH